MHLQSFLFFFYFFQIPTDFVCIYEKVVMKKKRQLEIIINSKYREDNVEMFLTISYIHQYLIYLKKQHEWTFFKKKINSCKPKCSWSRWAIVSRTSRTIILISPHTYIIAFRLYIKFANSFPFALSWSWT
jgi:hypothetical protein